MHEEKPKTPRREFIRKIAAGVPAAAAAGTLRPGNTVAAAPPPSAEDPPRFNVVSPLGESTVKMITMAPRLSSLSGKTVAMMWNAGFKANVTLPVIAELLKENYPGIKIIPYTDMPESHLGEAPGTPQTQSIALQAVFKEKRCDALISGNGG